MKKSILLFTVASLLTSQASTAQTTAMDFNRMDCNGTTHHLFADLDMNHVAILEFFMTNCNSCVTAGNKIKTLATALEAEFPNQIKSYSIGFSNSYSCTTVSNWVVNNSFTTIPLDSGATQVAYYGGFGMPTVVVVGGTGHDVLFSTVGFTTSDTTAMGTAVRDFFATLNTSITELPSSVASFTTFPNPANDNLTIQFELKESADVAFRLTSISGQTVSEISNSSIGIGNQEQVISTANLANGVYFLQMTTNKAILTKKIVILH